jgi:hypothetical protein
MLLSVSPSAVNNGTTVAYESAADNMRVGRRECLYQGLYFTSVWICTSRSWKYRPAIVHSNGGNNGACSSILNSMIWIAYSRGYCIINLRWSINSIANSQINVSRPTKSQKVKLLLYSLPLGFTIFFDSEEWNCTSEMLCFGDRSPKYYIILISYAPLDDNIRGNFNIIVNSYIVTSTLASTCRWHLNYVYSYS